MSIKMKNTPKNTAYFFNFLGKKSCRGNFFTQIENLGNNQVNPFNGKFRPLSHKIKQCNLKLKKNKNRNFHIHNIGNKKILKESLTYRNYNKNRQYLKNKKSKEIFSESDEIPKAPHNTTQFLIKNYAVGRKEKFKNFMPLKLLYAGDKFFDYEYEESMDNKNTNEYDIDEICLTGGTMKGILNSNSVIRLEFLYAKDDLEEIKDKDKISIISTEFSIDFEKEDKDKNFEFNFNFNNKNITNNFNLEFDYDGDITSSIHCLEELKEITRNNEEKINELQSILLTRELKTTNLKTNNEITNLQENHCREIEYPNYDYS